MNRSLPLFAAALLLAYPLQAAVTLPAIISDHMVLQAGAAAPIWGWAEAGEEVQVAIGDQTKKATPGPNGRWQVKLDPLPAGAPLTLTVQGRNTITVQDVVVGEVWLGSGQSNMALRVANANNSAQEREAANPQIRCFTEGSRASDKPETIGRGKWEICSPNTVAQFSAALYFFGRDLQKELGGVVGLIHSSVGGTPIEAWIDADVQKQSKELEPFFKAALEQGPGIPPKRKATPAAPAPGADAAAAPVPRAKPGELYNGKIAPLIPYTIRGAIWYQGEANSAPWKAPFYQYQLPLLVTDWRAKWGQGDFPFAWAQLPNFVAVNRDWPTVREGMLKTLRLPNTGMTINMDGTEEKNLHPKNKQEIGRRFALWALGTVYNRKVPAISGPLPTRHEVRKNEIVVSFKHTDGGLKAREGELKGFTIAGADQQFVPALARVEGDTVVISSPAINQPTAARYSWANAPDGNLVNGAGLPATPFRTDTESKQN
jgi:sialate O-acetylesterase